MTSQEHHKQVFRDRIQRVAAGGPNTMAQIYVGRADSRAPPPVKRNLMAELRVLPVTALTGAFAMFLGQLASFHLFSDDGGLALGPISPSGFLLASFLIGIVLALIFGRVFRVDKGIRFLALAGGFMAMIWFDSNLIGSNPEIFAMIFSENYVIEHLGLAGIGLQF